MTSEGFPRHDRQQHSMERGKCLRVLELYSGIGGMHHALKESEIDFEVVGAADINTVANGIYQHNFRDVKMISKCIEAMSLSDFNKLSPDMIVMSPPCQPFVRVGKQKDADDARTTSFFHLLECLPKFEKIPNYILVENVKGFDTSITRDKLLETLQKCNFKYQEFLLSPLQFGIPNSRLRYYLVAKREGEFKFTRTEQIISEIPEEAQPFLVHRLQDAAPPSERDMNYYCSDNSNNSASVSLKTSATTPQTNTAESNSQAGEAESSAATNDDACDSDEETHEAAELPLHQKYQHVCSPLSKYMEDQPEEYFTPYLLQEKFFKRFWVMDIIKYYMKNSCCFTKRYAHHMEGSGSIVQMNVDSKVDLSAYKRERVYTDEVDAGVRSIKLRYFTPREISNLMCFPQSFNFPEGLTNKQCYRVLGNSLNVHVVAVLLRLLTMEDS